MNITIFDEKRGIFQISLHEVTQVLPMGHFFWLDIESASLGDIQVVTTALQTSEPMSSWLQRFGQRSRFEVVDNRARITVFAAGASGLPVEGHVLYTPSWLLTVHNGAGASMDRARDMCKTLASRVKLDPAGVVLLILNEFMSSFGSVLDAADEALGELEDQILQEPKASQLQQLSLLRKQMWSLHMLWEPQYEASKEFSLAVGTVPEMSEKAHYFQDYAEKIADLMDKIDDLRQRANEAMASYATSVSNRQSQIINRLTVISAIFLPLTFLTGYFGMNFQWMTDHVQSRGFFLFFGVGLFVAFLTTTLLLFKRKGWLGEKARNHEQDPKNRSQAGRAELTSQKVEPT